MLTQYNVRQIQTHLYVYDYRLGSLMWQTTMIEDSAQTVFYLRMF